MEIIAGSWLIECVVVVVIAATAAVAADLAAAFTAVQVSAEGVSRIDEIAFFISTAISLLLLVTVDMLRLILSSISSMCSSTASCVALRFLKLVSNL